MGSGITASGLAALDDRHGVIAQVEHAADAAAADEREVAALLGPCGDGVTKRRLDDPQRPGARYVHHVLRLGHFDEVLAEDAELANRRPGRVAARVDRRVAAMVPRLPAVGERVDRVGGEERSRPAGDDLPRPDARRPEPVAGSQLVHLARRDAEVLREAALRLPLFAA